MCIDSQRGLWTSQRHSYTIFQILVKKSHNSNKHVRRCNLWTAIVPYCTNCTHIISYIKQRLNVYHHVQIISIKQTNSMYLIELYLSPVNIPMIYITITPLVCNSKAANIICLIVPSQTNFQENGCWYIQLTPNIRRHVENYLCRIGLRILETTPPLIQPGLYNTARDNKLNLSKFC